MKKVKLQDISNRKLSNSDIKISQTWQFTSHSSWRDPTHKHHLSYFSFDMFCKTRNSHYLGGMLFKTEEKKLSFGGGISIIGRIIFKLSPEMYEKKFCFIFPASTLYIKLKAI